MKTLKKIPVTFKKVCTNPHCDRIMKREEIVESLYKKLINF
jgi:hypothetical protein